MLEPPELAEALRDLDDVKKNRNEVKKENKELKVRNKELKVRKDVEDSFQRAPDPVLLSLPDPESELEIGGSPDTGTYSLDE